MLDPVSIYLAEDLNAACELIAELRANNADMARSIGRLQFTADIVTQERAYEFSEHLRLARLLTEYYEKWLDLFARQTCVTLPMHLVRRAFPNPLLDMDADEVISISDSDTEPDILSPDLTADDY